MDFAWCNVNRFLCNRNIAVSAVTWHAYFDEQLINYNFDVLNWIIVMLFLALYFEQHNHIRWDTRRETLLDDRDRLIQSWHMVGDDRPKALVLSRGPVSSKNGNGKEQLALICAGRRLRVRTCKIRRCIVCCVRTIISPRGRVVPDFTLKIKV